MNAIQSVMITRAGWGMTILRIIVGVIFMAHGSQKLFGWFGGGGLALVIGLLVRPAAVALIGLLVVAIFSVHIHNGLFMQNNGYEFALALLGGALAVLFEGAGRASLDAAIAKS